MSEQAHGSPGPAKPVGRQDDGGPQARECPDCHATTVGDVSFCWSCGYDFTTGVSSGSHVPDDGPAPPRPTELQAAEPHEAFVDARHDRDGIDLATPAAAVDVDLEELAMRPSVPPPTPPSPHQEHVAHALPQTLPPSRQQEAEWVAEIWVDHAWAATRDADQPVPAPGRPTVVPLSGRTAVIGRTNLERGLRPDVDAGRDAGVSVRHAQLTSDGQHWWVEDLDTSNGTYVTTVGLAMPREPIDRGVRVRIDEDDRVYLGGWTRLVVRRQV